MLDIFKSNLGLCRTLFVVLTVGRVEPLSILRTPAHLVNVRTAVFTPVVIRIFPLVKMHKKTVANHVGYRGNTYQIRILTIHGLQLHADLETVLTRRGLRTSETNDYGVSNVVVKLNPGTACKLCSHSCTHISHSLLIGRYKSGNYYTLPLIEGNRM